MAKYNTSEFKSGLKIMVDGNPCHIVENEFVKPGKGQAFNRVKIRNLLTGRVIERTYKSGDTAEAADVVDVEAEFLYEDGQEWHFMVPETYEQMAVKETALGDAKQWLKAQDICVITLWNNEPIQILPPNFVTLIITDTDPGLKGDTARGGTKPATLETGAVVRVPLFVQKGESIKVDTRTGDYVSRAKDA